MTAPASLLTEWARLLAASLEQAGLETAVISPGSRSTPFAHALLQAPGIHCISAVDERAAAFFAVGHARMTGRPVALLCTSGSAAANYYPAVVEAARGAVPLLVLTADRPFELQESDAPQTIDQVRMFGAFARAFLDPGMPDAHPDALRALRRLAVQAFHRTTSPIPGPVQVNLRARKPLEPAAADDAPGLELRRAVDRLLATPGTRVVPAPATPRVADLGALARRCRAARRGLIVCGPATPAEAAPDLVLELARRTGFALAPEATSQLRFNPAPGLTRVDALDTLLRSDSFARDLAPDLVIEVGAPPTSSAWRDYLRRPDAPARAVVTSRGWSDPHGTAELMITAPLGAALRAVLEALERADAEAPDRGGPTPRDQAWHEWLERACRAAWDATEEAMAAEAGFHEGAAVRAVVDALPADAVLALGNSLPIREVDTFCPAAERPLTVWSQRGANGIDGLIAGTAGAAAAAARPTALLVGDVSFLHDLGGLAHARAGSTPLALIVLDNAGGRIFEQLPLATADAVGEQTLDYWLTPPRIDFRQAAGAFGLPCTEADSVDAIGDAVRSALSREGATVVRAVLDGDRTTPLHRALRAAAVKRLRGIPAPAGGAGA